MTFSLLADYNDIISFLQLHPSPLILKSVLQRRSSEFCQQYGNHAITSLVWTYLSASIYARSLVHAPTNIARIQNQQHTTPHPSQTVKGYLWVGLVRWNHNGREHRTRHSESKEVYGRPRKQQKEINKIMDITDCRSMDEKVNCTSYSKASISLVSASRDGEPRYTGEKPIADWTCLALAEKARRIQVPKRTIQYMRKEVPSVVGSRLCQHSSPRTKAAG
ncbi:hypothetical protein EYC84_003727 [Monilinia fructicola]|uniref:Uncharacterized protein n=1 Tax=Monilinia fructicola TaxID=38448 RepID=A0A5M9JX70_MONFR|nr:hypothetical protein EYC84_003727 [Monilinia fructicola]